MKILVLSDLHVEFSAFTPDKVASDAADVIVLAGDIHNASRVATWARLSFPGKQIVLVSGNHELYGGDWDRTLDDIRESALHHQVHFLENDTVTIEGVQFLGAALWTDFEYFGVGRKHEAMAESGKYLADYFAIKGCTAERTVERHMKSLAWLQAQLAEPGVAANRVVVTHHYPRKESTAAKYQSDLCTAAFGSQLPDELFTQMGLWIHGHTHSSHSYRVGACKVVCNPRGYPRGNVPNEYENLDFNPSLVVEQTPNGQWARAAVRQRATRASDNVRGA